MARETTARLVLAAADAGGLKQPLRTPTPSLVFKPAEAEQIGIVGVVHLPEDGDLMPGADVEARVVFPLDDADRFVEEGRQFLLWNGRVVGTAEILEVLPIG